MGPIADLHCDLLAYLEENPHASPYDATVPCAIPYLQQGGVHFQTLALFTETYKGSTVAGLRQAALFSHLMGPDYPELHPVSLGPTESSISCVAAIENASVFAEEDEPLGQSFQRLFQIIERTGTVLYVSLTWNHENRFGGGTESTRGLRPDGVELLRLLADRSIAVDVSHASDALACDILNVIDQEGLDLQVLASHSNARAICSHPRNLPDFLISELIQRNGLIGLNFFRGFAGQEWSSLASHVEHMLNLGAQHILAFGADFFHVQDPERGKKRYGIAGPFFKELSNSASYPTVIEHLRVRGLTQGQLRALSWDNVHRFMARTLAV